MSLSRIKYGCCACAAADCESAITSVSTLIDLRVEITNFFENIRSGVVV